MATKITKGKVGGGSAAGAGRSTTINKRSAPRSGKPVRTHPLSKGMPGGGNSTAFRRPSAPVPMPNPNKFQRDRMDALAVQAHAHTSIAAPIKAYPINDRSGAGKKAKVTVDTKTKNARASRRHGY
jgi:hypothetical protein